MLSQPCKYIKNCRDSASESRQRTKFIRSDLLWKRSPSIRRLTDIELLLRPALLERQLIIIQVLHKKMSVAIDTYFGKLDQYGISFVSVDCFYEFAGHLQAYAQILTIHPLEARSLRSRLPVLSETPIL